MPSCHTTAISEEITTAAVERQQRVNQNSTAALSRMVMAKNTSTERTPSMRSPTSLAKPVMCTP
ncbi:hypothetical protein D3C84_1042700 [compost metagenome]